MLRLLLKGLRGLRTVLGEGYFVRLLRLHLLKYRQHQRPVLEQSASVEPVSDEDSDMEEEDTVEQEQVQDMPIHMPTKKEWLETTCRRLNENDSSLHELEIDPGLYSCLEDLTEVDLQHLSEALCGNTRVTRLVLHNLQFSRESLEQLLRSAGTITSLQLDNTRGYGAFFVAQSIADAAAATAATATAAPASHDRPYMKVPRFSPHHSIPHASGRQQQQFWWQQGNKLTDLRLCHASLDLETVTALSKGLSHMSCAITKLDLQGAGLDNIAMHALCKGLSCNRSVLKLCLDFNGFKHDGMKQLGHMLRNNNCLQELHLFGNNISAQRANFLAAALPHNTALKTLILSFNDIGDQGATALAHALTYNTSLKKLWMPSNNIGNDGIRAFAYYLPQIHGLTQLSIGDTFDDDAAYDIVHHGLKRNMSLTMLYLESPTFTNDQLEHQIDYYLRLNMTGRKHLLRNDTSSLSVPIALWGVVLQHAQKYNNDAKPDVLYYLLRQKPELLCSRCK